MIRHKKVLLLIPLLLVAVLTVIFFLKVRNSEKPIAFETATVKKGSIAQTISATGTVEPVDKGEVGTQVSGVVKKIYVDFNSTVTKGQLLAELDKITLQATLDLNKVTLRSARLNANSSNRNSNGQVNCLKKEWSVNRRSIRPPMSTNGQRTMWRKHWQK
jgi:HlyD family secretion protein